MAHPARFGLTYLEVAMKSKGYLLLPKKGWKSLAVGSGTIVDVSGGVACSRSPASFLGDRKEDARNLRSDSAKIRRDGYRSSRTMLLELSRK